MKPYGLVCYNRIKFFILSLLVPEFKVKGIQMFSREVRLRFHSRARITFNNRIVSDGKMTIVVGENAILKIGERVYFNEDTIISCKGRVIIGSGCRFGPGVKVFDNNHKYDAVHGVSGNHSSGSIVIGENCWIGSNVVLLKGSRVGRNSVIGAGCVISGDIPESTVVTQGRELTIKKIRNRTGV